MTRSGLLLAALALAAPGTVGAQDYLLRLDGRIQRVAYRGVRLDSIPAGAVVPGPDGGPESPDGHAVSCAPGAAFCQFYRPGSERRGGPLVLGADLAAWGFGVRGLSLHANARLGLDLGGADVWPGTDPPFQLLEGYLEYANEWLTGRGGRQFVRGRLGSTGFDGGLVGARHLSSGLAGEAYLGLGLARGVALPVTAPALDPLDEFQPRERQLVAGANAAWQFSRGDLRVEYQREVDRDTRNFVAERVALSTDLRPHAGWRLTGGAEYDLARGFWGSSDLELAYGRRRWGAAAGVRRYRPYFDLWTLWGVFSPVPFTAINGSIRASPVSGLDLHASGERYRYADPGAATPLVREEDDGWRWSAGAGVAFARVWYAGADYRNEFGPGAALHGWEVHLSWEPRPEVALSAAGGRQVRPLEFRFDQSELIWVRLRADLRPTERFRLNLSATRYAEDRQRPDASAFDWNQIRLVAGVSWVLGSGADRLPLPPAVRRPGKP
ncbi:MAG TPA: hypothetical protein VNJ71_09815 [Gemmatimonadales bacterium]|nr:hypothetical protein [Gemmatimonadales bacterium]